jgi:hypothetical protein
MAAILGASLVFLGCDDSSDDSTVKSQAELAAEALATELGKATANGTTVTLNAHVELEDNITVPSGVTLDTATSTLTVPANKTLTVASGGKLNVPTGAGKIDVKVGAKVIVQKNGTLTTVDAAGLALAGNVSSGGTLVVVDGSTVKLAGSDTNLAVGTYVGGTESANKVDTATLATALGEGKSYIDENGAIALTDIVEITTGTVEVPYGVTLVVPAKDDQNNVITFTVDDGATLDVTGDVEVAGAFTMAGTFDIDAGGKVTVASGGTYTLESTGTGTNGGEIVIENGGKTIGKNGNIIGAGLTVVKKGGVAYQTIGDVDWPMIGSDATTDAVTLEGGGKSPPVIVIDSADGKVSFNNTSYVLDGKATLYGIPITEEQATSINAGFSTSLEAGNLLFEVVNPQFTIEAGSVLTVKAGSYLLINPALESDQSTLKHHSIVGKATAGGIAPQIVLEKDANLLFHYSADKYRNFYGTTVAKFESNTLVYDSTDGPTTFNWDATLGENDDKGGWLLDDGE